MRIKNKLSPYPILFEYSDDYVDSLFHADVTSKTEFGQVVICVTFTLENLQIEQLIKEGKAEYCVHAECPITSFRYKKSGNQDIEFKVNADDIKDKLEICTFITATRDIVNYSNEKFNLDYDKLSFNISKGNILAIGTEVDVIINKNLDELQSLSGLIKVRKKQAVNAEYMSIDLDSDYILISLPEYEYQKYAEYGKQGFKRTVLSMILFPAMVSVLSRMKINTDDILQEKKWYKAIEKILNENNVEVDNLSIIDGNGKYSVFKIAQQIFKKSNRKCIQGNR
ncbi:hypothetical protein DFR89_003121 [Clostridium beijerinckii]|uniref:hypothetical protein n=1 Tax=Clostridium beijerinckii TaxID=1520 RepID=UPI00156F1719|nr:hypothetical protein [Clostridium beijerinckii]NRZ43407.1 hypothetical protein [Clostridium beijerinckii]